MRHGLGWERRDLERYSVFDWGHLECQVQGNQLDHSDTIILNIKPKSIRLIKEKIMKWGYPVEQFVLLMFSSFLFFQGQG